MIKHASDYAYITLLGIVLCRDVNSGCSNILKLLAKNWTKTDNESDSAKSYDMELYEDIIACERLDNGTRKINITPLFEIFDDAFIYSGNTNISIGIIRGQFLIYLDSYLKDSNDQCESIKIYDNDLQDLIEWKNLLIEEERIPENSVIELLNIGMTEYHMY